MNVVKEIPKGISEISALVFTGDGRNEYKRLKYIAAHYDEDQYLHFPLRPDIGLKRTGRQRSTPIDQKRGFHALEALAVFKSLKQYDTYTFVFLVDREHVRDEPEEDLNNKLEDISTRGRYSTESLEEAAFKSEVTIGSREMTLLSAIIGDTFECMEDGLAALIELEWGESIQVENRKELKNAVSSMLSGGSEKHFLESTTRDNLQIAFPNLDSVLKTFE